MQYLFFILLLLGCKFKTQIADVKSPANIATNVAQNKSVALTSSLVPQFAAVDHVDGSKLVITNSVPSPKPYSDYVSLLFNFDNKESNDYYNFYICQKGASNLCSPQANAPDQFTASGFEYPLAPPGDVTIFIQACANTIKLLNPSEPCGPYQPFPYTQAANQDNATKQNLVDVYNKQKALKAIGAKVFNLIDKSPAVSTMNLVDTKSPDAINYATLQQNARILDASGLGAVLANDMVFLNIYVTNLQSQINNPQIQQSALSKTILWSLANPDALGLPSSAQTVGLGLVVTAQDVESMDSKISQAHRFYADLTIEERSKIVGEVDVFLAREDVKQYFNSQKDGVATQERLKRLVTKTRDIILNGGENYSRAQRASVIANLGKDAQGKSFEFKKITAAQINGWVKEISEGTKFAGKNFYLAQHFLAVMNNHLDDLLEPGSEARFRTFGDQVVAEATKNKEALRGDFNIHLQATLVKGRTLITPYMEVLGDDMGVRDVGVESSPHAELPNRLIKGRVLALTDATDPYTPLVNEIISIISDLSDAKAKLPTP